MNERISGGGGDTRVIVEEVKEDHVRNNMLHDELLLTIDYFSNHSAPRSPFFYHFSGALVLTNT